MKGWILEAKENKMSGHTRAAYSVSAKYMQI